jgi:Domain of unknown function (DUF4034)
MSIRIGACLVLGGILLLMVRPLPAQVANPATNAASKSSTDDADWTGYQWEKRVEADLVEDKFDDLDRMADKYRREKTRQPGGVWKLRSFYELLDSPELSDADSSAHLEHLQKWMTARPESVTARIALATSLDRWAWIARGHTYASGVSPEGWRLFKDRSSQAAAILTGAANLPTPDPQFYAESMMVGLEQQWDAARMQDMLERGLQLEPGYYYLDKHYATYLLPKWHGKAGDSAGFAKDEANRAGGEAGDQLYYEIATTLLARGNDEFSPQELDWQRIQRGYASISAQYGTSERIKNDLAYMAWRYRDVPVAASQFALIGDKWSRGVWGTREFYDKIRDWSKGLND